MIVPPRPMPTVALPTVATGPRRSVSPGVSIRLPTTISTQKRIIPATSENALSTWSASIHWSKLTRGSYAGPSDDDEFSAHARSEVTETTRKGRAIQKITPCLWFDTEGEEAAQFYTSLFPNSRIVDVTRYGSAGPRPEGSVMTVDFELDGQRFIALNGGPQFKFNEAISLEVDCENQEEVDKYWNALTDNGEEGPCGWLKDKYGVSWQIVPRMLIELISDPDQEKAQRVIAAMLKMQKIEIDELERAAAA